MLGKLPEVTCVVSCRFSFLPPWLFRLTALSLKLFVVIM